MDEVQGLRRVRNRSLLGVNEDFELKCNAEIHHNKKQSSGLDG